MTADRGQIPPAPGGLEKTEPAPIQLTVNAEPVEIPSTQGTRSLLCVLRDDLGLTGTKYGCGIGYCGACTVLVDGRCVAACVQMVGLLDCAVIRTVEGLSTQEGLDPVQEGFIQCCGLQCGFCTPAHLMAARELLDRDPNPSESVIQATVDGLYCRCTGYRQIKDSIRAAAEIAKRRG
jgi:aerobic-type carbon monoxide dehydrogenase small subunit (CoxS/CutS family)